MWDVLAPIVRWPLYSPRRFIGVVIVAFVTVFMLGEINDGSRADVAAPGPASPSVVPARPSPPASAMPAAVASGDASAATDALSVDPADEDPSAAAADSAAAFVAAWARPDLDADAWAAGVRPLVTTDLWSTGLNMTVPSSTPAVTVRGEPRQVAMNPEGAVLDVPTTGPWVRVHVVHVPAEGKWLVSDVEPVD